MSRVKGNHHNFFRLAILASLLLHTMLFYVLYPELNKKMEFANKKVRFISLENFPGYQKKGTQKSSRKKVQFPAIPNPVPAEYQNTPDSFDYLSKENISDELGTFGTLEGNSTSMFGGEGNNPFLFGMDEFKPPDYDDIMIGVLGKNAEEGDCIYSPEIVYPEKDISAYIEGMIVLKLTINKSGKVVGVYVIKGVGNTEIESAAKEAALKRLYKPVTRNGQRVFFQDEWTINFNLK